MDQQTIQQSHNHLFEPTDDDNELDTRPLQNPSQGRYQSYYIIRARCRLCQLPVQNEDLLVADLGHGRTSPWFTFVNDGDCTDDKLEVTLHMTLADRSSRDRSVGKAVSSRPAICFHIDCHQARGSWDHTKAPFLAATRYTFRPNRAEERRRLEYNRYMLAHNLQFSFTRHGAQASPKLLPLDIRLMIAGLLDRPCAMMSSVAASPSWELASNTVVNLALPVYASYMKMDGRHYVHELRNQPGQITYGLATRARRLVVPPIQHGTSQAAAGDILIAVDHLGVRQVFFIPPGRRSDWQRRRPDVAGAWWMAIPRPTTDAYWLSSCDGVKVRKLKPMMGNSKQKQPEVYWKEPVLVPPSMIELCWPRQRAQEQSGLLRLVVHMRNLDLNLPDTLGLCVAMHTSSDKLHCILDGIACHHQQGSLDNSYTALFDSVSLANMSYWVYMPLNRGERVTEIWGQYNEHGPGERFAEPNKGFQQVIRGLVFFTNQGRSRVFGGFGSSQNMLWRRLAYLPLNLPCRIFLEQKSLTRQAQRHEEPLMGACWNGADNILVAMGEEVNGMAPVIVAHDNKNAPPMPSCHSCISPDRDDSLWKNFSTRWVYTCCPLSNITKIQLCIDHRTTTSPAPVVMGMLVFYADGGRACAGQFRPDWAQKSGLWVEGQEEPLYLYHTRVEGESLRRLTRVTNAPPSHESRGDFCITLPQEGILEWWFKQDRNFMVHSRTIIETGTGLT